MTLELADGRGELFQWDTGRIIEFGEDTVSQAHFTSTEKVIDIPYTVEVKNGKAAIPDELLQVPGKLIVYAWVSDTNGGYTKVQVYFPVFARPKPSDYVYTPTEHAGFDRLRAEIGDLADLTTEAKDTLVAAINEAAASGGADLNQFEINAESGSQINDYVYQVTLDKTYDEIDAAFESGRTPIIILDSRYRLQVIDTATGYSFWAFSQMGPGMYGVFGVYVSSREEGLLQLPLVDYASFEATIGDPSTLQTTAKDNLVAAINEIAASCENMDLRVADGYIQYSTDGGSTWTNLIAVAELKGDKGDKGAPGKTPVKGTDYWTASDKAEIVNDIHPAFYIDLAGDYPNYTCPVAMDDIKAAYNSGYNLVCRCTLAAYTATLPLFVPMPAANTWIFSGSGALNQMGFVAQSFTVTITAIGVVAENTRLARGDGTLPNPSPIRIKVGDTTYIYNGSEPVDVTIDDGTEVSY